MVPQQNERRRDPWHEREMRMAWRVIWTLLTCEILLVGFIVFSTATRAR